MRRIAVLLLLVICLAGCTNGNSSSYSGYENSMQNNYASEKIDDGCCKHCTTGQACGDSCISRSYTCHKGPGCACDY